MSVKNMLPIIGVGSAAALIGLVASRRVASRGAVNSTSRPERPSGIMVRSGDAAPSDALPDDVPAAPQDLPQGFWDAAPESAAEEPASLPARYMRERDESIDRDDLSADWLARATQAPYVADANDDTDDPAEIAADSLSMISDASRHAARADDEDDEIMSER